MMTWVIIIAFTAFVGLAFALLYPVYRLLKNEERRSEQEEHNS